MLIQDDYIFDLFANLKDEDYRSLDQAYQEAVRSFLNDKLEFDEE